LSLHQLSTSAHEMAIELAEISRRGPIPAVGHGDKSVGMTLMDQLGMQHTVDAKPRYKGLVISARRGTRFVDVNRVNLFAKVPDWEVSVCKSSREIVDKFGYDRDGARKLYCTISARQPNSQSLQLRIDRERQLLREQFLSSDGSREDVVAWKIGTLKERLAKAHPESAWVVASSSERDGIEYFHFRFAQFTSSPRVGELPDLLDAGTVTVDHLIMTKDRKTTEKGPLFKIKPANVSALFPVSARFDLMSI
jgi:hypothetical protein